MMKILLEWWRRPGWGVMPTQYPQLALHNAVRNDDLAGVHAAFAMGASVAGSCVLDDTGYNTPIELARSRGNREILEVFEAQAKSAG